MRRWTAQRIAEAAGARLFEDPRPGTDGPARVVIDSRAVEPGDLFVGLAGEHEDGGTYAPQALQAGAWGVLVSPQHTTSLHGADGAVLTHPHPLSALQALARTRRRELGARVVAITGSTGKTSTKDILAALLGSRLRVAASPENLNTEIGLPLAVLAAPDDTEVLVLEMAMRGAGQIAELAAIAEPDVGVIVNIGPVHLESLGSIEAIASAKAELLDGLAPGAVAVVPAHEPLLEPHLRADMRTITFGERADVRLVAATSDGEVEIRDASDREHPVAIHLRASFTQAHNRQNLLAAVAAARALDITATGELRVSFSALRGQRRALRGGVVLIDDCYNANPMSMRAALDDLAETARGRRVAVLGDMLELGAQWRRFHRDVGAYAAERGVTLMIAVGDLAGEIADAFGAQAHRAPDAASAAALLQGLLRDGDTVLVKGSRGVGLERVGETLAAGEDQRPPDGGEGASARASGHVGLAPSAGPGRR
jgi:UDP-N-acetylmuramoyl-tripeptide--D-alanyl-D-alanine ligase